MSNVCQVTGKRVISGKNVSHAKNRTPRRFYPNVHERRIWVEDEKRFIKIKVSAQGIRRIDKLGIKRVMDEMRARGERI